MDLLIPELGLFFWQTIVFLIVLFVLSRFAWKPIMTALKERESSIEHALESAEKAKSDMLNLTANNEKLLDEARAEKDQIIKAASKIAEEIKNEAKEKASLEMGKVLEEARKVIESEKLMAVATIKNQIAAMSVEIAEKLLKSQLENPQKQKELVDNLIKDLELN